MYGMVNRSVEQLVRTRFGEEAWDAVKARAGVDIEGFISMSRYPDEMTYALVAAAAEILEIPADEILRSFGHFWVTHSADQSYGQLMQMCGSTLPEFLGNLDAMHARLALTFPKFQSPAFRCSDLQEGSLVLHYYSTRAGLAPFVVGLLEGLALRFGVDIAVSRVESREQGADHDSFLVRYGAAA